MPQSKIATSAFQTELLNTGTRVVWPPTIQESLDVEERTYQRSPRLLQRSGAPIFESPRNGDIPAEIRSAIDKIDRVFKAIVRSAFTARPNR